MWAERGLLWGLARSGELVELVSEYLDVVAPQGSP